MKSERLNQELDYSVVHLGLFPDEEGKRLQDKWVVIINGQSFDYFTGIGRRVHKLSANCGQRLWRDVLHQTPKDPVDPSYRKELEHDTKAVPPTLDDVLYALIMDSDALDQPFEDWAGNLGYDTDSRKALATYLACQENGKKLRRAGVKDLDAAREAFQDY